MRMPTKKIRLNDPPFADTAWCAEHIVRQPCPFCAKKPKATPPKKKTATVTVTKPKRLSPEAKERLIAVKVEYAALNELRAIRELAERLAKLEPEVAQRLGEMLEDVYAGAMNAGEDTFGECWTLNQTDMTEGIRIFLSTEGYDYTDTREISEPRETALGGPPLETAVRTLEELGVQRLGSRPARTKR